MDESVKNLLPVYILVFLRSLGLSLSITGPILPLYVRSLGVSMSQWGLLSSSFAVGLISFEAFWGFMSDRINRIMILTFAMVFMAIIVPLYTFQGFQPYFFLFQFLMGSFMVMVGPTTRALIADHSPDNQLGFNMSLWSTCVSTGGIIGPSIAGYLSKNVGYETVFYTSSIILFLSAAVLLIMGRSLRTKTTLQERVKLIENIQSVFRSKVSIVFVLAFLIYLGVSSVRSFLPIYVSELYLLDEVRVGLMITVGTALQLFITPFIGVLSDRYNVRNMLMVTLSCSGILFLLLRIAITPIHVTLLSIGLIISFSSQSLSLITLSKLASREKLGITMGIYGSFEDLGLLLGPLVYGYVWETYSPQNIYLISAGAAFTAIFLLYRTK